MTQTDDNLKEAFAGESQANRRYTFFAEKAEKEGLKQVARLFRAAAEAETVHARNHFNAMDGVGSSIDNISAGVIGEHLEFTRMYPGFIEKAEEEGNERAQKSFEYANQVEEIHYNMYQEILKKVKAKQPVKDEPYYVCPVCGNTVAGNARMFARSAVPPAVNSRRLNRLLDSLFIIKTNGKLPWFALSRNSRRGVQEHSLSFTILSFLGRGFR